MGTLQTVEGVWSPERHNTRDVQIYLPPSYHLSDARYPVVYMHDGQNLFDEATAFADEWKVDEHMERLSELGLEAIVVGVPNMGKERCDEYSPFPDPKHGGGCGDAYLTFILETLKPRIDDEYRTRPERDATGILGSSMGGLISLYAFFRFPESFGFAGVMSPSLWFANRAIFPFVEAAPLNQGRLYLDIGTAEGVRPIHDVQRMHGLLLRKGYRSGDTLLYVEDEGGEHSELAWARRLKTALYFLLPVS